MGVAPAIPVPDAVDLPPRLLVLLTRWSAAGEEIPAPAASRPKGVAAISCAGDSRAEDGAVFSALLLYLGVRDSPFLLLLLTLLGPLMYSRFSRLGNVWLRGRWKFEASAPGGTPTADIRPCCWGWFSNRPLFGSGENVNCEVGLKALPENVELVGSVIALDSDVVLCECGCL